MNNLLQFLIVNISKQKQFVADAGEATRQKVQIEKKTEICYQ